MNGWKRSVLFIPVTGEQTGAREGRSFRPASHQSVSRDWTGRRSRKRTEKPMSQQYQPTGQQTGQYGQPSKQFQQTGRGQPMGKQQGQQSPATSQGMGQQQGSQFHTTLPIEFRTAIEDFATVTQTAEWCADKCIEQPGMAECARACEDLADLADLNEKLIARDSVFGPQVAEAYLKIAQQTLPILRQYEQSPPVSETLVEVTRSLDSAVTQSLDSVEKLLSTIGYQPTMQTGGTMGQQSQGMTQGFQGTTQGFQGATQQPQGTTQGFGQGTSIGQGSFQQGSY